MVNSQFSVSIHILTLLATDPTKVFASSYIASSVNTNPALIRKLVSKLNTAGFVASKWGPEGGSYLSKPANEIPLSEVFAAVIENGLYALHSDCNPLCPVGSVIEKSLRRTFSQWESGLLSEMGKKTIADVLASLTAAPKA